jgi:hypothetical protein
MKYKILSILALLLLVFSGAALAGKGGPIAAGYWEGSGEAIYPDGTKANIVLVQALLAQDGNFIHGGAAFSVIIGDADPVTQEGQMSGHLRGNKVKGLLGGCFGDAPNCVGAGVFEGKLSGNRLTGTVLDLSDGSTSVITLYRVAD